MRKAISKDGTSIAFDESGVGPVVVLVGGALTQRSAPGVRSMAALLAQHFTVINFDRRGRGDSGDTTPYAVAREVEDIEALIDESGGSAFVYGHSSGAALALEAARTLGIKIKKLALYEPPFMANENDDRSPADHVTYLKELLTAGRRGDMVEYFMTEVTGAPAEAVAPMKNSPMWAELLPAAHTLLYDLAIMGDYSVPTGRISSIKIPTLALDGGASPGWAANSAQMLVDTLPNAQRRTLKGQTHNVDPATLAPVLVEFFET